MKRENLKKTAQDELNCFDLSIVAAHETIRNCGFSDFLNRNSATQGESTWIGERERQREEGAIDLSDLFIRGKRGGNAKAKRRMRREGKT